MTASVQAFITDYWEWLKNKTVLKEVDGWVEVTTPYLDRHNDFLQIYVRQSENIIQMTDDGYTIRDLRISGVEFDTPRRKELLQFSTRGYGVTMEGDALVAHATKETFPLKKHGLVQAMLAVNDLFYVASANVVSMFAEDVAQWLDVSDIRYTSKVKFTGKSGYDHLFDFVVPASRQAPERIIKTINRPSKEKAQNLVFAWLDTREVRQNDAQAYAVLNDVESMISPAILDALREYNVRPLLWSHRDDARPALAA